MNVSYETYQRYLEPGSIPFDSLQLAEETKKIICRSDYRKYTKFIFARMYGGIVTGYTCGCCLRCIFCWVHWCRDFPEKYSRFYSPEEQFRQLNRVRRKSQVLHLRVSGAEPTIGKAHLLGLLEKVENSPFRLLILETNGIFLGADPDYAKQIACFKKVHTRLSIKAGTPKAFTKKTGAVSESFELPFKEFVNLIRAGISFHVAAMSADSRIVDEQERHSLVDRLTSIDPSLIDTIEEEVVSPYHNTLERLRHAGLKLEWD